MHEEELKEINSENASSPFPAAYSSALSPGEKKSSEDPCETSSKLLDDEDFDPEIVFEEDSVQTQAKIPPGRNIYKVFLFLLILAFIFLGFEFLARQLMMAVPGPSQVESLVTSFNQLNKDEIEILVFGNSHSQRGIDPADLSKKGFSFALTAQDLYYDFRFWEKYSPELTHLQYVIIPVDHFSFGYDLGMLEKRFAEYYAEMGIPARRFYLRFYCWIQAHSYLIKYRAVIVKRIAEIIKGGKRPDQPPKEQFIFGEFQEAERRQKGAMLAGRRMNDSYHKANEKAYLGYLTTMIYQALERNIRVLLVTLPTNPEYYNELTEGFVLNFHGHINRLLGEFHEDSRLAYVDFTGDPRFTAMDYYDVDHLNPSGARKLAKILDEKIHDLSS
ncbi:MAG TPA: SGNH/GDSL hydrolase family protein [bacterium]|nr:SGNH/GDSL hydrolase family protein [bacterium]